MYNKLHAQGCSAVKPFLYLLSALLAMIIITVSLLLLPATGKYLLQRLAYPYLDHHLVVRTYRFNLVSLYADGRFDDGSIIQIQGTKLWNDARSITVRLRSNVSFFDRISATDLPNVDFNGSIVVSGGKVHADADVLHGKLHADLDLSSLAYAFKIDNISIDRYLADQQLPPYASGTLSAQGQGSAAAPYGVESDIKSYNIRAKDALTSLSGLSSMKAPVDINATGRFAYRDWSVLQGALSVKSPLFELEADRIVYTLSDNRLSYDLSIINRRITEIPAKHAVTSGSASFSDNVIDGSSNILIDNYRLNIAHLRYTFSPSSLHCTAILQTLSPKPLNLTGQNTVEAEIDYLDNTLDAALSTPSMPDPLRIRYEQNRVDVISNNIPIDAIASIFNRPLKVSGNVELNGSAEMKHPYPKIALRASTKNLMPDANLSHLLNLNRPASLTLDLTGNEARYRAIMTMRSQITGKGRLQLLYDDLNRQMNVDASFQKLILPGFRTDSITMRSDIRLAGPVFDNTEISTPYETVTVPHFDAASDDPILAQFTLGGLDRFFPDANRTTVLRGDAVFKKEDNQSSLNIAVEDIGTVFLTHGDTESTLFADHLDVANIFNTLGYDRFFSGQMEAAVRLSNDAVAVSFYSDQLVPSPELGKTLKSFPLRASLDLKRMDGHLHGKISTKSASDSFALNPIDIDLDNRQIVGGYRLVIADAEHALLRYPSGLLDSGVSLHGRISANSRSQRLSLQSDPVVLSNRIHRLIEANTSDPLPIVIDIGGIVNADAAVTSSKLTLSPLQIRYDSNTSGFSLDTEMATKLLLGDANVSFRGNADNGGVRDGSLGIATRTQELNVTDMRIDPKHRDYNGRIRLALAPIDAKNASAPKSVLYGEVHTRPEVTAFLKSESFDGNLSAVMNRDLLVVHAKQLSLPQLLRFVDKAPAITDGRISVNAILSSPALLDGNISRLNGGIDARFQNVLIKGSSADEYLQTLQNSQDLSLFQGSVLELPVIRNIKNLPGEISRKAVKETNVTKARIGVSIKNGILVCQDCAASTHAHRVAAAGNIDLPRRRFNHFYVALLNPSGCPYFMQEVTGKISDPQMNLAESGIRVIGGAVMSVASNVTDAAN